jgi:predicted P-loop ATPase
MDQMAHVSRKNSYDPLTDYLAGLKWDGEARTDSFLERYCGARTKDEMGRDITEHIRRISGRWLISAVARALRPGCKVDTVLVLEGVEGIKKSTAFTILGGEWFADSQIDVTNKDSKLLAAQSWIIELAELASLLKSDGEAQRAFFSSAVDKFRPPYLPAIEVFPRRCVFVGTTNREEYLSDDAIHRRFWPVACGKVDADALRRDRDQLWAEAVVRFQAGEIWYLTEDEIAQANSQAASRKQTDPATESIWSWWLSKSPENRPEQMKVSEVANLALQIPVSQIDYRAKLKVANALKQLGFIKKRVDEHGREFIVYEPTEELKKMLMSDRKRPNWRVLPGGKKTTEDEATEESLKN